MSSARFTLRKTCVAFIAVLLVVPGTTSWAGDTPVVGGGGGEPFRITCPDGQFLVGIAGRAGSWIDRIQTICAPFDATRRSLGPPGVGIPFGGHGGAPTAVTCPGQSAISGWEIQHARSQMVEYVAPECRTLEPPHDVVRVGRLMFGRKAPPNSTPFKFGTTLVFHGCPHGELAIGLHGASGNYIDRVGLICASAPSKRVVRFGRRRQ